MKKAVLLNKNLNHWSWYVEKKGKQIRGYKQKNPGEGSFRRRPLAEFGADVARSFADETTGVRGTDVRPRGCRWRSGAEGRQRGILKQA